MSQLRSTHQTQSVTSADRGFSGDIAIDIECINLVVEPDLRFDDPSHWTLFCVPIGYRNNGDIETDVLFRRGSSLCDERRLIDRVLEWIRSRRPARIMTYNGESYDLPILRHRSTVTTRECRGHHDTHDNFELVFDAIPHVDVFNAVKDDAGFNVPLESALSYHDITVTETYLAGEEIGGGDMPELGLKILSGTNTYEEIQAVQKYAESDVRPLFELADAVLDEE